MMRISSFTFAQDSLGALTESSFLPDGVEQSLWTTSANMLGAYWPVLSVAFVVSLIATPIARWIALESGVVDRPDAKRKMHAAPVAYLGGAAVFFGILFAIGFSYTVTNSYTLPFQRVPISVVIGMLAITFTGLADDVWGWDPRLKIAGQLVAAAGLAIEDVGVRVAQGAIMQIGHWFDPSLTSADFVLQLGIVHFDLIYWVGTAIIAVFVLGGANAANLVDGLDGLLSGTIAIAMIGFLVISLFLANQFVQHPTQSADESLAGARVVLCLATLGAVLGFLPYNYNPARIFLGDCGSLLLGYMCAVVILMLGKLGYTHLVFAGLIVFGVPLFDTTLAIARRKLTGRKMSDPDREHFHHVMLRRLGTVKRAVWAIYGVGALCATTGILLAALVFYTPLRAAYVYSGVLVVILIAGLLKAISIRRRHVRAMRNQQEATSVV